MMMVSRMEKALQKLFILILDPCGRLMMKLNRRTRTALLLAACLLIPIYFILVYSGKFILLSQLTRHLIGLGILLLLLLTSINGKLKMIRWRRKILWPLLLSGIGILIVSFIHPVGSGYRVFALMLILVFPALAFVWINRRDYGMLFDCLSVAISLVGCAYLIICVIGVAQGWVAIDEPRFRGTMSHSGGLSQLYTSVLCSGLYLGLRYGDGRLLYYAAAVIGISCGMLALGQGRSCILACLTCLFVAVYFYFRYVPEDERIRFPRWAILFAVLLLCAVFAASVPSMHMEPVSPNQPVAAENSERGPAAEKQNVESGMVERFSAKGKDVNSFSSGRIGLWTMVAKHLNLLGNDVDKQSIHNLTKNDWLIYAHNVFLEISYRCGIPVGLIFILLEVLAGCVALKFLFMNREKKVYLAFPVMFLIIYVYESMLDCASMPFILESGCYYYLSLIPMLDAEECGTPPETSDVIRSEGD